MPSSHLILCSPLLLKSLLQHHSSKASILWCSAFFTVQLSHPYMTTGKTIALTRRTFAGRVMSLLLNMISTRLPSNFQKMIGTCGERAPPLVKVMRKEAWHTQRRDQASGVSLEILEQSTPKTRVCLLSALCFHLHL